MELQKRNLNSQVILSVKEHPQDNNLHFVEFVLSPEYCREWRITLKDFVGLAKGGKLLRETLYRVGGQTTPDLDKVKYFLLLKHFEDMVSSKYLASKWCILDKDGNERIEFKQFDSPYIVKDSVVYSLDGDYYNIETGEFYCHAYHSLESKDFLFLDNRFDDNKEKRGVMKINKENGKWELFPE